MQLKYKKLYKNVLKEYQKLSHCAKMKVAALLVDTGRIISVGYNGTPSGQCHCDEIFRRDGEKFFVNDEEVAEAEWYERHHEFAKTNEIHAEQNLIGFCMKNHVEITPTCAIVLSHEPCEACARLIYSCGIKHVMYHEKYDRGSTGLDFLQKNGVIVENI